MSNKRWLAAVVAEAKKTSRELDSRRKAQPQVKPAPRPDASEPFKVFKRAAG
ncbi:MAG: hypothetical protein AAF092_00955 [Pseudomonadota bacterium]